MKFNRSVYQALSMIGQFGINMLVPIFVCSILGMFLDRRLGTNFLIVIFFFVGALAGGFNVFRFARQIYMSDAEQSAYLHKGRKNRSKTDEKENHTDQSDSV